MPRRPRTDATPVPKQETVLHTRERILREAMRLFGEQGYAGTTVAQIEEASGLSPGSGALYRHYATKQDILIAGFAEARAKVLANRAAAHVVAGGPVLAANDEDLTRQLSLVYDLVFAGLDNARNITLVLMKNGRELREIVGDSIDDWLSESLLQTAENMQVRQHAALGEKAPPMDYVAEAYLLLAPLTWARIIEWNHGALPAGLTHERLKKAWVSQLVGIHGEKGNRSAFTPRKPRKRKSV
jgi:AcrR family transcriptional regulator